jgi:hypothetical protein
MNIITKSQFARLAGVTPAAITKQLSRTLQEALSEGGVDIENPVAIKYLNRARTPGRNPGTAQEEIGDYVISRFTELHKLTTETPSPLVKKISDVLFYISFARKQIGGRERADLIHQVERAFMTLREDAKD